MTPWQSYGRKRRSALARANAMVERVKARFNQGPLGATSEQWEAYVAWLNEWKDTVVALRDNEISRLTHEQLRRDNERKRNRRAGRTPRGR